MGKPTKNTQIIDLTKSFKGRQFGIGAIKHVIREDGTKGCVWCGDDLKTKHPAQRYCKDKQCSHLMRSWGYPQKENGLWTLLARQNFCCNLCFYDYKPFIDSKIVGQYYGTKSKNNYLSNFNYYIIKRLKSEIDKDLRPEVDHIIPVSKGGQSLGMENHQALCFKCHKAKTKIDNSGKRKK